MAGMFYRFIIGLSLLSAFSFGVAGENTSNPSLPDSSTGRYIYSGQVFDAADSTALTGVTVVVEQAKLATQTNADGKFRLVLPPGHHRIKFSHVGYRSFETDASPDSSKAPVNVYLNSVVIEMGAQKVFTRAYDPAQRIIAEAIAHKHDILEQIHDYKFDAYVKFILNDLTAPEKNIFLITESQTTSYWEKPDKYKEIIAARKQSANLPPEANLVSVGGLLNFNRNRIEIGEYNIVSPVATDALDNYNYYLLDTAYIDKRAVFVLEIEPQDGMKPLFVGEIQIVDSTFEVVRVDVGFTDAVSLPMVSDIRYYQHYAPVENNYWMPIEIGFNGIIKFNVPFPGIPSAMSFDYVASIYSYDIDEGLANGTFDEYLLEVQEMADEFDSAAWAAHQTIPLSAAELRGYQRIDSLENAPKPFMHYITTGMAIAAYMLTVGNHDLFHYNRVEGSYLGLGTVFDRLIPDTRLRIKTGYGFKDDRLQYEYGLARQLLSRQKLWIGGYIRDEIIRRPTIVSDSLFNPTFDALFFKYAPFDYFREKGYELNLFFKPLDYTRLKLAYLDVRHLSEELNTSYSFFRKDSYMRPNPAILEGKMRSLTATFKYDSRKLIRDRGRDLRTQEYSYLKFESGIEFSSPDIAGDYDFARYFAAIDCRIRFMGGLTSFGGYAGASRGDLPPQRYFIADYHDPYWFKPNGLNTAGEVNFGGDRMALLAAHHDFGKYFLGRAGLHFLDWVPFGLQLHAAALWSEFARGRKYDDAGYYLETPAAYTEIGFSLSNLTPFINPFNGAMYFNWQLSHYDTGKFTIMYGIGL